MTKNVTCVDLALNGRSSKSFRDEGAWKKALAEKASELLNDQLFGNLSGELGLSRPEAATLVDVVRSMRRAAGDFA